MESRYDYDIIRDYLHGLADRKKAIAIGELIRTDEIARGIAAGILLLEKEFQENEGEIETYLENFRITQLKKIHSRVTSKNSRKTQSLWLKIAAAVLLMIAVGVGIQKAIFKPDALALVDEDLSQPYPVANIFRGLKEETDYSRALEAYQSKNYPQASRYFEKVSREANNQASAVFYNGLSCLYSGNYHKAIQLLASDQLPESRHAQQAQWYLSLAYIKSGDIKKGIEVLKEIETLPQHYQHQSAGQLLEAIE
jgi:TolA-binding protein